MTVAAPRRRAPSVREKPVRRLRSDPAYPPDRTPTMPETLAHELTCHYALHALRCLTRQWPDPLLVGGNMDLYLHEGDPRPAFAPDVLVAYDVALDADASYRFWLADKPPDLVMEVASVSTVARDKGLKREAYASAGIPEYWQCDSERGQLLQPPLQGWRLQGRSYVPIAAEAGPDADRYYSEVLQTWWGWLRPEALPMPQTRQQGPPLLLRLWNPSRAAWYPPSPDTEALREQAEDRADRAEDRADRAESRADRAESRADRAESRADAEIAARRALQAQHQALLAWAREAGLDLPALGLDPEEPT